MEQKQSNLVTFWKKLFGTAEKKNKKVWINSPLLVPGRN